MGAVLPKMRQTVLKKGNTAFYGETTAVRPKPSLIAKKMKAKFGMKMKVAKAVALTNPSPNAVVPISLQNAALSLANTRSRTKTKDSETGPVKIASGIFL